MPSAVIAAYEYDAAAETLTVRYQTGKVYQYLAVPEKVFKAMLSTMYKGPFLNREIKGHYAYREIKSNLMIQDFLIADDGVFPGNKMPALLYKGVLDIPLLFPATHVKDTFEKNGWSNSWDAGIFTHHHYHSLTHEVLGIYAGKATVQLGDNSGPKILLEKATCWSFPRVLPIKTWTKKMLLAWWALILTAGIMT